MPAPASADAADAELVERCRRGDESAWAALVGRYQRLVYAVVMRAGLDTHAAADVFQTVFERLLAHLPRLQQPDRLQAWIVTTCKRETQRLRARGLRTVSMTLADDEDLAGEGAAGRDTAFDIVDESPRAEEALADLQQLHLLRLALNRLDERCRQLLTLLFADDDRNTAYEAVTQQLGMPHGSIGPTRSRCLDKLRRLLQQAGP